MMNRRTFFCGLTLGTLVAPLAGEAQQVGKVWRIGFISVEDARIEDILFQQLKALGYVEGQNLVVERRYSEGRTERFAEFATEFVRLNLDMIIVTTTPAVLAVKNATKTIPIVQPNSLDPVGTGLVGSLARPGGNFTGTTQQPPRHSRQTIAVARASDPAPLQGCRGLERGQSRERWLLEGTTRCRSRIRH